MDERLHVRDRADGQQVDAKDDAASGHEFRSDLAPSSWGGAQVDAHLCRTEKVILLVYLTRQFGIRVRSHVWVEGVNREIIGGDLTCDYREELVKNNSVTIYL